MSQLVTTVGPEGTISLLPVSSGFIIATVHTTLEGLLHMTHNKSMRRIRLGGTKPGANGSNCLGSN